MILEHYQTFYYKQKELKEVFYINGSSTNFREFYQVLLKHSNMQRIVEYSRDEKASYFIEKYQTESKQYGGFNKMSKDFIYKVTKFYEVAELPENCSGSRVKWVKDTSEPETIHKWTQENYNNACSKSTLKYFRKVFNSRQVLKTKTDKKTGKTTTILHSYAPDSLTYRSTFIIEEV